MRSKPNNIELKEILIKLYFEQGKISACIVIAEELNIDMLRSDVRAVIAKYYQREDNHGDVRAIIFWLMYLL